jgi:hypothetical protein
MDILLIIRAVDAIFHPTGNEMPLQTGDGTDPDNVMTRMKISTSTSGIRFHEPKNMGMSSLTMT